MTNRFILSGLLIVLWGQVSIARAHGGAITVRYMQQFTPSVLHDLPVMTWKSTQNPHLPPGWKFIGNVPNFLSPGASIAPVQMSGRAGDDGGQAADGATAPQVVPADFNRPVVQSQRRIWLPASADMPVCVFQDQGSVVFIFAGDNDVLPTSADSETAYGSCSWAHNCPCSLA